MDDVKRLNQDYDDSKRLNALMSDADLALFDELCGDERTRKNLVGDEAAYALAVNGDFSSFERLSGCARMYLATRFWNEHGREFMIGDEYVDDLAVAEELNEYEKNPLFRLAISVRSGTEENAQRDEMFAAYDDYMNANIMKESLRPFTREAFTNYKNTVSSECISDEEAKDKTINDFTDNIEKQVTMAKVLMLGLVGQPQIVTTTENGVESHTYEGRFANLLAHCSRISVELPRAVRGDESREEISPIKSIMGEVKSDKSGVYKRSAATHDVQKRVTRNGQVIKPFKEIKGTTFTDQYGMDVAIGGLGNAGISNQVIRGNGTAGHMFIHAEDGFGDENGAMLIGFESDSPTASGNQQGHTHTVFATPEKMSSFLGNRNNELGDKYGGRYIDLTKTNAMALDNFMSDFENLYRGLSLLALNGNDSARERLEEVNEVLCGKNMSAVDLTQKLIEFGMDRERVFVFVGDVRKSEIGGNNRDVDTFTYLRNATNFVNYNPLKKNDGDLSADAEDTSANDIDQQKKVARPPINDIDGYMQYRNRLENSVRARAGEPRKHLLLSPERSRINEGYLTNAVSDSKSAIREQLANDLYPPVLEEDKVYFKRTNTAADNLENISEAARPAARAIVESMRELSEHIADMGIDIKAYDTVSTATVNIKQEDARFLTNEEINAVSKALAGETGVYKTMEESHFETLNKVYGILAGKGTMDSLSVNEKAYVDGIMKQKGVQIEKNRYDRMKGDGTLNITLSDKQGLKSLDEWKNASDDKLSELFADKFLNNPALSNSADMVGKDIYDCLYVCSSTGNRTVRDYFKDRNLTEKQMQANYMRMLIKNNASGCMMSYDDAFNPHVAKLQVISSYKEELPKTHFWNRSNANRPTANEMYQQAADAVNNDVVAQIKTANTPNTTEEFINRTVINSMAKYLKQNALESRDCVTRQINDILKEAAGAENGEDIVKSPVEAQLYMLSKGVSFDNVLSVEMTEEKKRLINEYYNLKAEPESEEYKAAVADMKKTLTSAIPPSGDLSDKDVILGNLREIYWLNGASELFRHGMSAYTSGELDIDGKASKAIDGISWVTSQQLKLVDTFVSDSFKKPVLHPFDVKDGLDAKATLACMEEARKTFDYSTFSMTPIRIYGEGSNDISLMADKYAIKWIAGDRSTKLYRDRITDQCMASDKEESGYYKEIEAVKPKAYTHEAAMEQISAIMELSNNVDRAALRDKINGKIDERLEAYAQQLRYEESVANGAAGCAFLNAEAQSNISTVLEGERAALTADIIKKMPDFVNTAKQEDKEQTKTAFEEDSELYNERRREQDRLDETYSPDRQPDMDLAGDIKGIKNTIENIADVVSGGESNKSESKQADNENDEMLGAVSQQEFARTDYAHSRMAILDEIREVRKEIYRISEDMRLFAPGERSPKIDPWTLSMTTERANREIKDELIQKVGSSRKIERKLVQEFEQEHNIKLLLHHSFKNLDDHIEHMHLQLGDARKELDNKYQEEKRKEVQRLFETPDMLHERDRRAMKYAREIQGNGRGIENVDPQLDDIYDFYKEQLIEANERLRKLDEAYRENKECVTDKKLDELGITTSNGKKSSVKRVSLDGNSLTPATPKLSLKDFMAPIKKARTPRPILQTNTTGLKIKGSMAEFLAKPAPKNNVANTQDMDSEVKQTEAPGMGK